MRALVVGAYGFQGRRTVAELARAATTETLVLAGRHAGRLQQLATRLGNVDFRIRVVDAGDEHQITAACDGVDVVVSCAGPAHTTERACIEAAIGVGVPCVTLADDLATAEAIARLRPSAEASGTTIVSGCGLSPGLTNMLAVYAAAELDEVEEIEIATAYSLRDYLGPASVISLIRTFSVDASYVSEWMELSGRAGDLPELAYLPDPVAWVETFTCSHPEVRSLRRRYPGIRNLHYRFGLTERAGMDAIRGAAALRLAKTDSARRAWGRLVRAVQPVLAAMPPRSAGWTGARVDVRGHSGGRRSTISLGVADHLANLTSSSLVYGAIELTTGRIQQPGIWAPEEIFSASSFLEFLYSHGMRVARLTPQLSEDGVQS